MVLLGVFEQCRRVCRRSPLLCVYREADNANGSAGREMTPKEKAVLRFIKNFKKTYPPTLREIAKGCRFKGHSTADFVVGRLVYKELVTREAGTARSIVLVRGE